VNSGITEKKSGNHFIPTLFYTLRAVKEERESMIKIVGTWERTDKEVDRHWNVLATLEHDLVTEDFSYTGGEYHLHGRDWDWAFAWERLGLVKSKMASVEEIRARISLREHDVINVSCIEHLLHAY